MSSRKGSDLLVQELGTYVSTPSLSTSYIAAMAQELSRMAKDNNLSMLNYLLEMVQIEASRSTEVLSADSKPTRKA